MTNCLHLILPTKRCILIVDKTSATELLGKGALIMSARPNLYDVVINNDRSEVTLYAIDNVVCPFALAIVIDQVIVLVDKETPPIAKGLMRLGAYASVPSYRKHFLEPLLLQ